MLKELKKLYIKHSKQNSKTYALLEKSFQYISEFVGKIDNKRLLLKQSTYTLEIAKYFKEIHNIDILKGKQIK